MIVIRKSEERGHYNYGWLETRHTFSFNTYYDLSHMGFRTLRVINEDFVLQNEGFGTHPHKDMEIITYIIDGELTHTDNTGIKSIIKKGNVQVMTAGLGIEHSELNESKKKVHLLQIWIQPSKKGLIPRHDEKQFAKELKKNKLHLIVSNDAQNNSLMINQDVLLFTCMLEKNKEISYMLNKNRGVWIQVISGELQINKVILSGGDGAAIEQETNIKIVATSNSEFLLFDLM
ncbi:MAG: pirin family protein [Candidatus Nanoarchaeia archaeon]